MQVKGAKNVAKVVAADIKDGSTIVHKINTVSLCVLCVWCVLYV